MFHKLILVDVHMLFFHIFIHHVILLVVVFFEFHNRRGVCVHEHVLRYILIWFSPMWSCSSKKGAALYKRVHGAASAVERYLLLFFLNRSNHPFNDVEKSLKHNGLVLNLHESNGEKSSSLGLPRCVSQWNLDSLNILFYFILLVMLKSYFIPTYWCHVCRWIYL